MQMLMQMGCREASRVFLKNRLHEVFPGEIMSGFSVKFPRQRRLDNLVGFSTYFYVENLFRYDGNRSLATPYL